MKMVKNAVGRMIPEEIDGRILKPFAGAHTSHGGGRKAAPPIKAVVDYENKLRASLDEAIEACEIKDGMTVSFHHHIRNGDAVVNISDILNGLMAIPNLIVTLLLLPRVIAMTRDYLERHRG